MPEAHFLVWSYHPLPVFTPRCPTLTRKEPLLYIQHNDIVATTCGNLSNAIAHSPCT